MLFSLFQYEKRELSILKKLPYKLNKENAFFDYKNLDFKLNCLHLRAYF